MAGTESPKQLVKGERRSRRSSLTKIPSQITSVEDPRTCHTDSAAERGDAANEASPEWSFAGDLRVISTMRLAIFTILLMIAAGSSFAGHSLSDTQKRVLSGWLATNPGYRLATVRSRGLHRRKPASHYFRR